MTEIEDLGDKFMDNVNELLGQFLFSIEDEVNELKAEVQDLRDILDEIGYRE